MDDEGFPTKQASSSDAPPPPPPPPPPPLVDFFGHESLQHVSSTTASSFADSSPWISAQVCTNRRESGRLGKAAGRLDLLSDLPPYPAAALEAASPWFFHLSLAAFRGPRCFHSSKRAHAHIPGILIFLPFLANICYASQLPSMSQTAAWVSNFILFYF